VSLALHMLLHCLLVAVLAPIAVLVSPWRIEVRSPAAHLLTSAPVAWSLFVGTQVAFHLGGLYARSGWVDSLSHFVYLATALLFWEVAIGSTLRPRRLHGLGPAIYLIVAMPAVDLSAAWLMAKGEPLAGAAMVAGMMPIGLAAAISAWRFAREEEAHAGAEGAA
jgi:cytochrome c oxidase assembly factor CtaG